MTEIKQLSAVTLALALIGCSEVSEDPSRVTVSSAADETMLLVDLSKVGRRRGYEYFLVYQGGKLIPPGDHIGLDAGVTVVFSPGWKGRQSASWDILAILAAIH